MVDHNLNSGSLVEGEIKANSRKKRRRRRRPRLTGLSKQRQTANARERNRMRSISDALLHLRYHLPQTVVAKDKKLSKIQTLRLAIRYISDLFEILQSDDGQGINISNGQLCAEYLDGNDLLTSSENSTTSSSCMFAQEQQDFASDSSAGSQTEEEENCRELLKDCLDFTDSAWLK
ncbi:pancreas transcription factor 1 subunit alpha-like [Nematostella vectensis]|uniref:pancreas transcription factor 1 subunit alpha-like n=1 Tax=Nematostella vectensis TaxID=45351 RepID=UPI002076E41D|nr:pancreas transcription factor 1 subunit alpha-like [Nematostella vectensis]